MKHDWEDWWTNPKENLAQNFMAGRRRKCRNCGVVQTRESIHYWMRVVGYQWYPKVGRCKGKKGARKR